MVLFAVLVADVETRQADGGTADVQAPTPRPAGAGTGSIVDVSGLKRCRAMNAGAHAEADHVGQAVELAAEIGGVAGEAGQPPIKGVEQHGDEDQIRRGDKR